MFRASKLLGYRCDPDRGRAIGCCGVFALRDLRILRGDYSDGRPRECHGAMSKMTSADVRGEFSGSKCRCRSACLFAKHCNSMPRSVSSSSPSAISAEIVMAQDRERTMRRRDDDLRDLRGCSRQVTRSDIDVDRDRDDAVRCREVFALRALRDLRGNCYGARPRAYHATS
jgi:hypothetical protein